MEDVYDGYYSQEKTQARHEELIQKMKDMGAYPITQHPDYEQDIAFDIDDICDLLVSLKKSEKK